MQNYRIIKIRWHKSAPMKASSIQCASKWQWQRASPRHAYVMTYELGFSQAGEGRKQESMVLIVAPSDGHIGIRQNLCHFYFGRHKTRISGHHWPREEDIMGKSPRAGD